MGRFGSSIALAAVLALAVAAPARADLIAAYERVVAGNGYDIALVNLSTLQPIAVPSGVNTTADEIHPSLTGDGRRLAFTRVTPPTVSAPGDAPVSRQVIVFDRSTRTEIQPSSLGGGDTVKGAASIAVDGSRVLAGTAGDATVGARVTLTSMTSPFAQHTLFTPPGTLLGQSTVTPSVGAGTQPLVAWSTRRTGPPTASNGDLLFPTASQTQTQDLHVLRFRPDFTGSPQAIRSLSGTDTIAFGHPAIAATGPLGLDEVTALTRIDIGTRTATSCFFTCSASRVRLPGSGNIQVLNSAGQPLTPTPAAVSSSLDERLPAWSPDGRYLAFVRTQFVPVGTDRPPELRNRILVFDFATQTLVQGMVFDTGRTEQSLPSVGNLSLAQTGAQILCGTGCQLSLASSTTLTPTQTRSGSVGIIVQRVVGFQRLLGRRVPRLRFVGRVPFGRQAAGRLKIDWDRTVDGRPLRPGRYLITFRALNRRGTVRELAEPARLRVRRSRQRGGTSG